MKARRRSLTRIREVAHFIVATIARSRPLVEKSLQQLTEIKDKLAAHDSANEVVQETLRELARVENKTRHCSTVLRDAAGPAERLLAELNRPSVRFRDFWLDLIEPTGPLLFLRAFAWFCSKENREMIELIVGDLKKDVRQMTKEKRCPPFIFAVLLWKVVACTMLPILWDGFCRFLSAVVPFTRILAGIKGFLPWSK
jgi:hypothetical protein